MNKKHISKTIMYAIITTFSLSPIIFAGNNEAFAFLGVGLFGGSSESEENQSSTTTQSSTSLQSARCYSPTGSIIDSCNSGDLSNSENTGYNSLGQ